MLERGYSITRDTDGRVVRRASDLAAGALVETEVAEGRMISRVETTIPETTHPGENQ